MIKVKLHGKYMNRHGEEVECVDSFKCPNTGLMKARMKPIGIDSYSYYYVNEKSGKVGDNFEHCAGDIISIINEPDNTQPTIKVKSTIIPGKYGRLEIKNPNEFDKTNPIFIRLLSRNELEVGDFLGFTSDELRSLALTLTTAADIIDSVNE